MLLLREEIRDSARQRCYAAMSEDDMLAREAYDDDAIHAVIV